MRTIIIAFLLSIFSVFALKASQELEQMIIETDVEGVKKLLPTVKLDSEAKINLIDLANDIILKRLKTVEEYSFEDITGDYDFNVLKESLSQQTIAWVDEDIVVWKKWRMMRNVALIGAGISFCVYMRNIPSAIAPETDKSFGLFVESLGACWLTLIGTLYSAHKMAVADSVMLRRIRSNLLRNYYNSILIKRLIINAPVAV